MAPTNEPPPVWPQPNGSARGPGLLPLYEGLPLAAMDDPVLYELLALFDALRAGQARERELAARELERRLGGADAREANAMKNTDDLLIIGQRLKVSRAALQELVRRYHIRRLALFGSAARGELKPDSDIDLIVEFESGEAPSLWAAQDIQQDFVRLFGGRQVDIAPPEILRNPFHR